jgi:hypothetical protein
MTERRYECVMEIEESRITVNVFIREIPSKEELKTLALQRGVEFMKEFGREVSIQDITLIGYYDRGVWE